VPLQFNHPKLAGLDLLLHFPDDLFVGLVQLVILQGKLLNLSLLKPVVPFPSLLAMSLFIAQYLMLPGEF